jgi:uncharacterized protein YdhG (YjbR/CyaY superfamily)
MKVTSTARKGTTAKPKRYEGFTEAERSAMQDRVDEMKVGSRNDEKAVLAKISEMGPRDRAMGKRIHNIIKASVPALSPKLWYGMPSYAKDGKSVCFFKPAEKFKVRYATLGFNDAAKLDDGDMWPVEYAVSKLTPTTEAKIGALVKKAAG